MTEVCNVGVWHVSGNLSNRVSSITDVYPVLEELARSGVTQWKYRPIMINERAVPIIQVVAVTFR